MSRKKRLVAPAHVRESAGKPRRRIVPRVDPFAVPDPGSIPAGEFKGYFTEKYTSPFVEDPPEPAEERRKVYNPRRMCWEWGDTGEPVEGPTDARKPARCGTVSMSAREAQESIMPYGQYKGLKLAEVPARYLRYALREHSLNPRLAAAIALTLRTLHD